MTIILITIITAVLGFLATRLTLQWLQHKQIMAVANDRSSHTGATPTGGGLGIMLLLIPALLVIGWQVNMLGSVSYVTAALVMLVAVSWLDDVFELVAKWRFVVQIAAVLLGMQALPDGLILQGLVPSWVEHILVALGWLWFINLYNFMDGIDGLAGAQTISIALPLGIIAAIAAPSLLYFPILAAIIIGLAVGFLCLNWHKAKLFMGDVGSIPLGFLLGFMMLALAAHGHLFAAAIPAFYYLADATYTITKRALRREKIWQAHRQHFYQRALVGFDKRHDAVVYRVAICNCGLFICSIMALFYGWVWALPAVLITVLTCWVFEQKARQGL